MAAKSVDAQILALCKKVVRKRARTVIDHILKHGHITTEELQERYGYDHPPRAARDVREEGIPLDTFKMESKRSGRVIAAYRFGDPSKIRHGRIGGRKAFSKAFKQSLIDRYGEVDAITSQPVEARYLQIDHRVPYEVLGDGSHAEENLEAFMLLDASSQRAKSWSCEHCKNWQELHDVGVCRTCYWASPESYIHVAMSQFRRCDIRWDGPETRDHDRLKREAKDRGVSLAAMIKERLKG